MEIITSTSTRILTLSRHDTARKLYPMHRLSFPAPGSGRSGILSRFSISRDHANRDVEPAQVKKLIIVDTKQPDRIGPLAELLKNKEIEVHVYDHHPFNEGDIRGSLEKSSMVGATARS